MHKVKGIFVDTKNPLPQRRCFSKGTLNFQHFHSHNCNSEITFRLLSLPFPASSEPNQWPLFHLKRYFFLRFSFSSSLHTMERWPLRVGTTASLLFLCKAVKVIISFVTRVRERRHYGPVLFPVLPSWRFSLCSPLFSPELSWVEWHPFKSSLDLTWWF